MPIHSIFPKKDDLDNLKTGVNELDIDKLQTTLSDLDKLVDVVEVQLFFAWKIKAEAIF